MAFDSSLYEALPQTNVPGTLALARSVLTAGKGLGLPSAKKALRRIRETGEALRELHAAARPQAEESSVRALDVALDRVWSAVAQRLVTYGELGGVDGAEALRIHGLLFPKGLGFVNFKYPEQWAESDAILGRITTEALEPALARFVGEPFLAALRERHAAYGVALGITKARSPEPEAVKVAEPQRAARAALTTYLRVVTAAVDNGELDASSALAALEPITALRLAQRASKKRATAGAAAEEGATATPGEDPQVPLPAVEA